MDVAVCPVTDRVVVADQHNKRVQVFDARLKHIMDIKKDGNGKRLKSPWGVAVNHAGEIIVSHSGGCTVSVYNQNGSYSRQLTGPCNRPCGIAIDTNDDIYVCDFNSIKVINKAGEVIKTIDCDETGSGQISFRYFFITICKNHLLVSDGDCNIHQLTKSGSYVKKLEVVNIQKARGLAVTAKQDVIIVDREGPIRVFTGDEAVSVLGDHGSEPWQLNYTGGVTVTRSGQIIVANTGKNNLLIYDQVKKIYIK